MDEKRKKGKGIKVICHQGYLVLKAATALKLVKVVLISLVLFVAQVTILTILSEDIHMFLFGFLFNFLQWLISDHLNKTEYADINKKLTHSTSGKEGA